MERRGRREWAWACVSWRQVPRRRGKENRGGGQGSNQTSGGSQEHNPLGWFPEGWAGGIPQKKELRTRVALQSPSSFSARPCKARRGGKSAVHSRSTEELSANWERITGAHHTTLTQHLHTTLTQRPHTTKPLPTLSACLQTSPKAQPSATLALSHSHNCTLGLSHSYAALSHSYTQPPSLCSLHPFIS